MKTVFPKSNIQIQGEIYIWNEDNKQTVVELAGLKTGKSGVYCLRNKLNGRLYIGMTDNLEKRRNRHFRDLKRGIHNNELLQRDCMELNSSCEAIYDPKDIYEFEIIQYCFPSQLTFWENLLIKAIQPYYNIASKEKEIPTYDELIGDDHEID